MPRHDFVCPGCGRLFADLHIPISIGAAAGAPVCHDCDRRAEWIPAIGAMDAKEPFQKFTVRDGRNQSVEIDSLRKLRQVERESEIAERNGEGQRMVFRRWAQDDSNRDRHTLGDLRGPAEAPLPAARRKIRVESVSETAAEQTGYGPGVNDSNTSALGGL